MTRLQKAIFKTLIYADIFDYPLTKTEINHWLIWPHKPPPPNITSALSSFSQSNSYYHLPSRQSIIKTRQSRSRFSQSKLKRAHRISRYLSFIPTIKLIAITGALSMANSRQHDDIDLFIITKKNRLWLTRLFSILLLELLQLRRRPQDKQTTNKICLNLFLDESSLKLSSSQRNLYTAHEVAQIKPVFNKNSTYQNFLNQNSWVKTYLPHAITITKSPPKLSTPSIDLFNYLETLAYKLQFFYMKSKITNETISKTRAFFHPRPTNKIVLNQYHQNLKKYQSLNK